MDDPEGPEEEYMVREREMHDKWMEEQSKKHPQG